MRNASCASNILLVVPLFTIIQMFSYDFIKNEQGQNMCWPGAFFLPSKPSRLLSTMIQAGAGYHNAGLM